MPSSGHVTVFLFLPFRVSWLGSLGLSTGFTSRAPGSKEAGSRSDFRPVPSFQRTPKPDPGSELTSIHELWDFDRGNWGPGTFCVHSLRRCWLWGRRFGHTWFCACFSFKWAWLSWKKKTSLGTQERPGQGRAISSGSRKHPRRSLSRKTAPDNALLPPQSTSETTPLAFPSTPRCWALPFPVPFLPGRGTYCPVPVPWQLWVTAPSSSS